jgi:uncharacterized protein YjiS (DUF1127 family)
LEVQIMKNQPDASLKLPLSNTFPHNPVRFIYQTVIDPVRRRARGRTEAWQLARLDDHLLRDIGLTRAQVLAAAFGPAGPDRHLPLATPQARSPGPCNVVRLRRRADAERVDDVAAAPLARRAAQA